MDRVDLLILNSLALCAELNYNPFDFTTLAHTWRRLYGD